METKPSYETRKNCDHSCEYYWEALEQYFPRILGVDIQYNYLAWSLTISVEKPHPRFDMYLFYILKDLSKINLNENVRYRPAKHVKFTFRVFWQRVRLLKEFTEYCSRDVSDICDFLFQPVVLSFNLI